MLKTNRGKEWKKEVSPAQHILFKSFVLGAEPTDSWEPPSVLVLRWVVSPSAALRVTGRPEAGLLDTHIAQVHSGCLMLRD